MPKTAKPSTKNKAKTTTAHAIEPKSPIEDIDYTSTIVKNKGTWTNRILIGTPMTGILRSEWVMARYGQIIPTNWSAVDCIQFIQTYAPMEYQVGDAQNLIVKSAVEGGYEWVLFLEHDNVLPPDAFVRINDYMRSNEYPVVSGLYFTKGYPSEPILYRGAGNSYYEDWKIGDKVMVSGIPMGVTLIHGSILKAMWDESPEYNVNGVITRRVFSEVATVWIDPEKRGNVTTVGTSDLFWCKRVIEEDFLTKAGWGKFAKKNPEFPFMVDTNIFVRHIDWDGIQWPRQIPTKYLPENPYPETPNVVKFNPSLGRAVKE